MFIANDTPGLKNDATGLRNDATGLIKKYAATNTPDLYTDSIHIIVGIDEKAGTITYHDFYGGYGQTMSFADYLNRNKYISMVIVPKNGEYKLSRPAHDEYLHPKKSMQTVIPLINKITFAHHFLNRSDQRYFDLAKEVLADTNFELVPPYYKVSAYTYASLGYIVNERRLQIATEIIEKAKQINQDLDKPFSDYWPGFLDKQNPIIGKSDGPAFIRGMIYDRQNEYAKAVNSYKEALAIWPYAPYTIAALEWSEDKLNATK